MGTGVWRKWSGTPELPEWGQEKVFHNEWKCLKGPRTEVCSVREGIGWRSWSQDPRGRSHSLITGVTTEAIRHTAGGGGGGGAGRCSGGRGDYSDHLKDLQRCNQKMCWNGIVALGGSSLEPESFGLPPPAALRGGGLPVQMFCSCAAHTCKGARPVQMGNCMPNHPFRHPLICFPHANAGFFCRWI